MKQKFHAYNKTDLINGFNFAIPPRGYTKSLRTDVILHVNPNYQVIYKLFYPGGKVPKDTFIQAIKKSMAKICKMKADDLRYKAKRKRERTNGKKKK